MCVCVCVNGVCVCVKGVLAGWGREFEKRCVFRVLFESLLESLTPHLLFPLLPDDGTGPERVVLRCVALCRAVRRSKTPPLRY